jgi:hypothetical protein
MFTAAGSVSHQLTAHNTDRQTSVAQQQQQPRFDTRSQLRQWNKRDAKHYCLSLTINPIVRRAVPTVQRYRVAHHVCWIFHPLARFATAVPDWRVRTLGASYIEALGGRAASRALARVAKQRARYASERPSRQRSQVAVGAHVYSNATVGGCEAVRSVGSCGTTSGGSSCGR